jgi:hypothetical protein
MENAKVHFIWSQTQELFFVMLPQTQKIREKVNVLIKKEPKYPWLFSSHYHSLIKAALYSLNVSSSNESKVVSNFLASSSRVTT